MIRLKRTVRILAALACCSMVAEAQPAKREGLIQRSVERRAVETVNWGMPAVTYPRMLQAAVENCATANPLVYWTRHVNRKSQTLTRQATTKC
jgi:hypothetical protein